MPHALAPWGYDGTVEGLVRPGSTCGRVIRVDRGECDVITAAGRRRVVSDPVRSQDELAPVTGDWVELDFQPGADAAIARIVPRTTVLSRRDPGERDSEQVLAANIDAVAIVHGLDRPLPAGRLERMLVMAEDSGADVVVVLTKSDAAGPDDDTIDVVSAVAPDLPVIATSEVDGRGFDQIRALMGPGRTLALIGASGVGKSSLVNALVGDEVLDVGAVRGRDAKGRHTTIVRELIRLPEDAGLVIDTPGIRAVGLWDSEEALHRVFSDLDELAAQCRFSDCSHEHEPGCAVQAATRSGAVDSRRVDRYQALTAELAAQRHREEQRRRSGGRRSSRRRRS